MIVFALIVLIANIIQGITGFAGTILAMPFSLLTEGPGIAIPALNFFGLLAGILVVAKHWKDLDWKEFSKIILCALPSMLAGIVIQKQMASHAEVMYKMLGILVIVIAVCGMKNIQFGKHREWMILASGVVHGMYVCGGPLLTGYLTTRIHEKQKFRATISAVWILLNGMLMISEARQGMWKAASIRATALTTPFLVAGMFIGGRLAEKMSRETFMKITYILLIIAGISLLVK